MRNPVSWLRELELFETLKESYRAFERVRTRMSITSGGGDFDIHADNDISSNADLRLYCNKIVGRIEGACWE